MSVRVFKNTDGFAQNIRQALDEGQEPVLSFSSRPVYDGKQAAAFQLLSEETEQSFKKSTQEICISKQDVDWTQGTEADHAVVIGSGSMQGGEKLVIKDSNCARPWFASSIDVLVPPSLDGKKVRLLLHRTNLCRFARARAKTRCMIRFCRRVTVQEEWIYLGYTCRRKFRSCCVIRFVLRVVGVFQALHFFCDTICHLNDLK
jgi:hypothetical protein